MSEDGVPLPWPDAGSLLARLSERVLVETAKAVKAGRKADGSGEQPPLEGKQGRLAREGLRPDARGWTGAGRKAFPHALKRQKIRVVSNKKIGTRSTTTFGADGTRSISKTPIIGTRATTKIVPGTKTHATFLAEEGARGHEYFYVGGDIAKAIEEELLGWLPEIMKGPPVRREDDDEKRADEARGRR